MSHVLTFLSSSVGKKVLMALTGFFLISFLLVHLSINLFIFAGEESGTYDTYAGFMATYPLLRPVEFLLFGGFLLHGFLGVWLWWRNRSVRPVGYAVDNTGVRSLLASRFTIVTGIAVLAFLVFHINAFFVQSRFFHHDKSMYRLVADSLTNPWIAGIYLAALVFLGYHLRHGFQSALQTFGLRTAKHRGFIDLVASFFWLLIPLAFALIPLFFLLYTREGRLP